MPVKASAKKALRNAKAKAARNILLKQALKRLLKNAAPENINPVVSQIDKAAKRGIIHPNKAARLKARLAKIASVGAAPKMIAKKKSAAKIKPAKVQAVEK